MFIKTLKYAIAACVLLQFYFLVINPCACCHCMLDSPLQRAKLKARKLYVELDRLRVNGQNPWPLSSDASERYSGSQQAGAHTNAVSYFNWLYRMEEYGQAGWEPRVPGFPISLVILDDVESSFTSDNVMWSIAEDVSDKTPDCAIVLVSSNFDCSQLISSYDGTADLPMATNDGKPAVFVMKNGAVYSLKPKYLNARILFGRQAFSDGPKSYLTPQGRVWVKGR